MCHVDSIIGFNPFWLPDPEASSLPPDEQNLAGQEFGYRLHLACLR